MTNQPQIPSHLVCVATIVAAHGVRGEVKIRTHTEDPESLEEFELLTHSGKALKITLRSVIADDMVIAHIEGINDRNAADLLRQTHLYVNRDELPDIDEDEFYHADLIGLAVHNDAGETIGSVVAMHDFGAGDIIEIALTGQGQTTLLPFTKAVVPTIDIAHKFIILHPPETHELDS